MASKYLKPVFKAYAYTILTCLRPL